MSYAAFEFSEQSGKPIHLYRFVIGPAVYRYTDSVVDKVVDHGSGPETYVAEEIMNSAPEQSRDLSKQKITLTVKRTNTIAGLFTAFVPGKIALTVYKIHDGDSEIHAYWKGRIVQCEVDDKGAAQITAEPLLTQMKRKGLRKTYGPLCQHTLYDANCSMDRDNFKTAAVVDLIDGDKVYASEITGSVAVSPWFVTGYAERSAGDTRMIIDQGTDGSGNYVVLLQPFNGLVVTDTIDLFAGCARDAVTCDTKFVDVDHPDGNLEQFFGFHVNPKTNPFKSGIK